MTKVVRLHQPQTLDEAVREIHGEFAKALEGDKKAYRARISAGQLLLALRKRIEAGEDGEGVNWWEWYASKFVRSRKDAEKVMRLASADDPDAAAQQERADNNEAVRKHRERGSYVRSTPESDENDGDLVDQALRLVSQMNVYQRRRFFAQLREAYDDNSVN